MANWIGVGLVFVARAALIGGVVISAAAYGLTRETTIVFFNQWLGGAFGLWVAGSLIGLRPPRIPRLAWVGVGIILTVGWASTLLSWMSWNWSEASQNFPDFLDDWMLYGASDPDLALATMLRTSALLGGFLIAIDLFASAAWSRALLLTVALTATGMVLFFFLQRSIGEPFLLRSNVNPGVVLSFATFRYWGNAASYLNLCWPLLAAFAAHTILGHRAHGWVGWLSAALMVFAALFINVSKAGQILAPIGLFLFAGLLVVRRVREEGVGGLKFSPKVLVGAGLPLVIIIASMIFAIPRERWGHLASEGLEENPRTIAFEYFVTMIPDAGWIGFGPGCFQDVYWEYVGDDPVMRRTAFWVAHQDYIQTVVEWGYLGTVGWGFLFAFPAFALLRRSVTGRSDRLDQREDFVWEWRVRLRLWWEALPDARSPLVAVGGVVAVALTALHSFADFPMQILSLQFLFLLWLALGWQLWRGGETIPGAERRRRGAGRSR